LAAKVIVTVESMEEEGYHLMVCAAYVAKKEELKDIITHSEKKIE